MFGAGTVQWSWGLDGTTTAAARPPSVAMQQATVNLLADMGVQRRTLQPAGGGGRGLDRYDGPDLGHDRRGRLDRPPGEP